jgi:hypothetical protein
MSLEKSAGGINTGSIRYRVFEEMDTGGFDYAMSYIKYMSYSGDEITDASIAEYFADYGNQYIKEVTNITYEEAYVDYVGSEDISVAATSEGYTVTALKTDVDADTIYAQCKVNGVKVHTQPVMVRVSEKLPARNVFFTIMDDEAAEGYRRPQLKSTSAVLNLPHSNIGSDEPGEIKGFVFDNMPVSTVFRLPTIADFDAATVDPDRTLIAWAVGVGLGSERYLAPGADFSVLSYDYAIAQWVPKSYTNEHTLEMDPISVEAGQTRSFEAYYYESDKTRAEALSFNDPSIAFVYAYIEDGGEDYAEVDSYDRTGKTISITGLKVGTATLYVVVVSVMGEISEIEVPITVTSRPKKNAVVEVIVDGVKKLIIIENDVWVKTAGEKVFKGKTYFIGEDGYLKTGLVTVGEKKFLFRKDGSKVFYTDSDVVDGKITVDGIVYVIDPETNEAEADHEHKWTAAWEWDRATYATATLTLTCDVGGEEITEVVASSCTNKGKIYTYTVSYEYAGETFSDSRIVIRESDTASPEEARPVTDDETGIVIVGLADEYDYTGAKVTPAFRVYDTSADPALLARTRDYTVSFRNNTNPGTAIVTITGKGNYAGKNVKATFRIVDRRNEMEPDEIAKLGVIKKVKLGTTKYTYTGSPVYPDSITITYDSGPRTYTLTDSNDYVDADGKGPDAVITFSNNVNAGTARIRVSGRNDAKGKETSKTVTYKILKAALVAGRDGKDLEVVVDPTECQWQAKGARPSVIAYWNGILLTEGQDYTVKYVRNTKPGKEGAAYVRITGKGNFKGTVMSAAVFTVKPLELVQGEYVYIAATTATAGVRGKSVKATVLDGRGNVIPSGKYTVTVKDSEGKVVTGALTDGADYTVEVTRKSAKVTQLSADTLAVTVHVGSNFNKAKSKLLNKYTATYTGNAITFTAAEFDRICAVTAGGATLKCGEDFEITGYTNNLSKGTMKVTLSGIGKYSGTRTVNIRIVAKKLK